MVFIFTGGHSKTIYHSLLVPCSMHSNLPYGPYYDRVHFSRVENGFRFVKLNEARAVRIGVVQHGLQSEMFFRLYVFYKH